MNITPSDENVNSKLYSQTEGDILGSYDIAKREVELFKGHNPSTLTHELGHHFIISHLNFMESIGANDKNKPVFEFLSGLANREINSVRDMERADHENLVEAFIDYMNIGQAPNIVTRNIFKRAKNWLINEYNIHKTKASKEIINKRLQEVIYHIMRIARVFYQKGCGGSVGIFIK